jgi:transposase-like protein
LRLRGLRGVNAQDNRHSETLRRVRGLYLLRSRGSRGTTVTELSPELRERATHMVTEVKADYPSEWAAVGAVAQKLGIGSAETLHK